MEVKKKYLKKVDKNLWFGLIIEKSGVKKSKKLEKSGGKKNVIKKFKKKWGQKS